MNYLQTIAIVRGRGQLTIPDSIRGKTDWVGPGSVVTVSHVKADEIVIRPHGLDKNNVNWAKLWRDIRLARSHKGKYQGRLSEFIVADRESH